jgi:hypothetical protein
MEVFCPVCRNLRYVFRPDGNENLRKLQFVGFMVASNNSWAELGERVVLKSGQVTVKFREGCRPPHPTCKDWIEKARSGCWTCQIIVDAVCLPTLQGRRVRLEDLHILASAVEGYPLQITVTDVSKPFLEERVFQMELFTLESKLKGLT